MLNDNKNFTPGDLTGVADCSSMELSGITVVDRLPDVPCKYAVLSQWTVDDSLARTVKPGATASSPTSGNAGDEMYWGFNGKVFAQLFTGERTEMLRVNNLNQICVKGNGTLYYAWFS